MKLKDHGLNDLENLMNGRRTNTGNYLVRSEMNVHIRSELADFALGQIREYMFQTKNEHVFITAYNETILVKQERKPGKRTQ